jgi:hypothetical protein
MIKACRPLLVFSRVSSTMMWPSLSSLLSALATKMGAGGKKQPLPLIPLPLPKGERDILKIEEFRRRHPNCGVCINRAAHDGSTNTRGRH